MLKISKGAVKELEKAFMALQMSEMLTYGAIETLIGKDPRLSEGRSTCLYAISRCLKRGVLIRNERTRGYYRAQTSERAEFASKKRERADRELTKGVYATSLSIIEETEFKNITHEQAEALMREQTLAGLSLTVMRRLNRRKNLPAPKSAALVDMADIRNLFIKKA